MKYLILCATILLGQPYNKIEQIFFWDQSPVVRIISRHKSQDMACGTGFITASKKLANTDEYLNYIITNRHLFRLPSLTIIGSTGVPTEIECDKDVKLELKYKKNTVYLMGKLVKLSNDKADFAVISFKSPNSWPTLKVSNKFNLPVGEDIFVVGYNLCGPQIYTKGYYTGREDNDLLFFMGNIAGGSSGSPVMNANFEVIGIATFVWSNQDSYTGAYKSTALLLWLKQQDIEEVVGGNS